VAVPLSAFSEPDPDGLTPLELHRRGYLRAMWADRPDEAQFHWAQIELIERGLTERPDEP
jgi:hypothetical protein